MMTPFLSLPRPALPRRAPPYRAMPSQTSYFFIITEVGATISAWYPLSDGNGDCG